MESSSSSPFWRLCSSPTAFLSSGTWTFWAKDCAVGPPRTMEAQRGRPAPPHRGGSEGLPRTVGCSAASLASTWASLVAQTVKNPPAVWGRPGFDAWVGKMCWRGKRRPLPRARDRGARWLQSAQSQPGKPERRAHAHTRLLLATCQTHAPHPSCDDKDVLGHHHVSVVLMGDWPPAENHSPPYVSTAGGMT